MGIYLMKPNTEKETLVGKNQTYEYAVSCMQGWRTSMEDAHLSSLDIEPGIHIFGVFDGHGGSEVAKFCQEYFIKTLLQNQNYKDKKYQQALTDTFFEMDVLMQQNNFELLKPYMEHKDLQSQAGCTAVVLLLTPEKYYVANAGDSRCVLYTKDKQVVHLSDDHKPDNEIEKKRITEAGGIISDGRINGNLNLSRALGDLEFKSQKNLEKNKQLIIAEPDFQIGTFSQQEDFFLLGCDGIWELKKADELCKQIDQSQLALKETAEALLDSVLAPDTSEGTGCDNMSCIIVKLIK